MAHWGVKWVECKDNLEVFACHVRTRDEHATDANSVRHFPLRAEKPHIWHFLDRCRDEPLLIVEKSRQIMMTWAACLYCLWVAKFHDHKLVFVQSKKEEDAANLVYNKDPTVARISFMELCLTDELKSMDFTTSVSYGQMLFPTHSRIWAIPEGGEKIRSYTASVIFSDEFAYQPEAEQAWTAARPTVSGGGQFIALSSVRPGAYMKKLRDL